MKEIFTKKEKNYLKDLLNKQVEDSSIHYPFELHLIQDKLELYPAKERMKCGNCRKTFINTRRKEGNNIILDRLTCEDCRI